MREKLLQWQWSLYPQNHQNRRNLLIHAFSTPLFLFGCVALVSGLARPALAVVGGLAMVTALALQGMGHKREAETPIPFNGPIDFVTRFFAEQWVTFPRYVLSGAFARAWRKG